MGLPLCPSAVHHGAMSDSEPLVPLVRGNLESMRELKGLLKKRGIESDLRRPGGEGGDSG